LLSLPFHSFLSYLRPPPSPPLFPYTTLFRSTATVPNGGESWSIGTTQTITWTKTGTLGSVRLDYSTDGGATYPNVINLSVPATPGSYSWTVPDTPTAQARVKVTLISDTSVNDASDANFSIKGTLTVTAPNGGETWIVGES